MSLYKTSSGFGVDFRDEFGRRVRKFVGSEEAARAIEAQMKDQAAQGRRAFRNLANQPLTITQAGQVLATQLSISPVTRERLIQTYARVARTIGDLECAQVTPRVLEDYQQISRRAVSQNTWSTEAYALRKLFKFLVRENFIALDPTSTLDVSTVRSKCAHVVTREEEQRLLDAAALPTTQMRLLLGLDAGCRRGEAAQLRANHVERETGFLIIRSSKTRSTRRVPMTTRLRKAVFEAIEGKAPDTLLSASAGKELKRPGDFMRALKERAKVVCRYHDLRHTFATRLAEVEPNPFLVADLLGHTMRLSTWHYVHVSDEQRKAAIGKMEAANPNQKEEAWQASDSPS